MANCFRDKISNEETALLPAAEFHGEIIVVDEEEQIETACDYLAAQPMIGFDTETRPSFRPGIMYKVALLQLSTTERCYLFRLNRIPFAKPLVQLLENPDVKKIGAAVHGDILALNQLRHFREGGFIDLQNIIPEWGIEEKSLRKMSAIVLGERVSKAQRLSNWEASTLTDKQLVYAATDAWVCTEIYDRLQHSPKAARTATPTATATPVATEPSTAESPTEERPKRQRSSKASQARTRRRHRQRQRAAARRRAAAAAAASADNNPAGQTDNAQEH